MSPPKRKQYGRLKSFEQDNPYLDDLENAAEDAAANEEQDGPPPEPPPDMRPLPGMVDDVTGKPLMATRAEAEAFAHQAPRFPRVNGQSPVPDVHEDLGIQRRVPKLSTEPLPGAEYTKDLPAQSPYAALSKPGQTWASDDGDGPDAENPKETAEESGKIPQVTARAIPHEQSTQLASTPDENGRPQPYGVNANVERTVPQLHQDVADAYKRLFGENGPPETAAPTQESFRSTPIEGRQTPEDMQRAWAINTMFGHEGDNFKAVQMMQGINQGLDQRQREQDHTQLAQWTAQQKAAAGNDNRPIPLAWAQQAHAAGYGDAESLVHLTRGEFTQMMKGNLGNLQGKQDATQAKLNVATVGALGREHTQDKELDLKAQIANQTDARGRYAADTNERYLDKKLALLNTPEHQAASVGMLAMTTGIERGKVAKFLETGSTDGLTPEQADTLKNHADGLALSVSPNSNIARGANQAVGRDATIIAEPGRKKAAELASPTYVNKIVTPVEKVRRELTPAANAVARLSKMSVGTDPITGRPITGLDVLAKAGTSGALSTIQKFAANKAVHQDMMRVYSFFIPKNHETFGANFTPTEQQMASAGTGIKFGAGMDAFADPTVIRAHMKDLMKVFMAMQKEAQLKLEGRGAELVQ